MHAHGPVPCHHASVSAASPDHWECEKRIAAARQWLGETHSAGLVVSTEASFTYFTGLRFDPLWSSATRSLVAVISTQGPLQLVLPGFVADEAAERWSDATIWSYDAPPDAVVPHVVNAVGRLPDGSVAFEIGRESRVGFTLEEWDALSVAIGGDRIADGQGLVWELRMRKSPAEIERLRSASRASATAFQQAYAGRLSGKTEREVARILSAAAIAAGADRTGWTAMTSGPGSYGRFVGAPRDRTIETGDMVWTDLGVVVDGYWSDYCRAAVVGGPNTRQMELQSAIVDATNAGIVKARAGNPVSDVAMAVRKRSAELGLRSLGFGRLGHGIGLGATEPPSVAEWDDTMLEPGMVITIEPAVVDESGLFCAEQVVLVTDGAAEVLSIAPTDVAAVT